MEELTLNGLQLLTSYGALGGVTIYFIWKDMTITKRLEETLQRFTISMETFFKCTPGPGGKESKNE